MNYYDILFYLFAIITLVSAGFVVTTRNVIYSAFFLLFTFFGVAGIYVLLAADFLAVVQIMVYVGGILILLIFGVMLTSKITNVDIKSGAANLLPASILTGVLMGAIVSVMVYTEWKVQPADEIPVTTMRSLGSMLLTDYVLYFELLGLLLLIALIGAASIARREKE